MKYGAYNCDRETLLRKKYTFIIYKIENWVERYSKENSNKT